jgi:tight adherence protein C
MSPTTISFCATLVIGVALLCAAHRLAQLRPLPRPVHGPRGLLRTRMLARTRLFVLEAALRWLAALCARARCGGLRQRVELWLQRAGHPGGLCADECFALGALLGLALATGAAALGFAPLIVASAFTLGVAAPPLSLRERARSRQRDIARRLPAAIDLMALCMGAGLDFSAALALIAAELTPERDALALELRHMLHELAMGRVRQRVLAELAERVPTPAVQDFVHAVIQAEQSGTPLAQVLEVQARMLRMRRSVAAEEAAARAGVLLVLPLLLLLCAVMLLMFGPFLVNGMGL